MNFTRAPVDTVYVPVSITVQVPLSPGMRVLLEAALFPGGNEPAKKVLAIKAVRDELACSLKEAKDIVDGLTRGMLNSTGVYHNY